MSPAPHDKSNNSPDFGANDWLIEEMRDQYQNDPSSVDPAWATFFHHEAAQASDEVTGSAAGEQPARQDPKPEPAPNPVANQKPAPAAKAEPKPAPKPAASTAPTPTPKVKDMASKPEPSKTSREPARPLLTADAPRHSAKLETVEPTVTKMKGAPMRTAKNMDQSLTMPTATTVRDVPMQLVIEQRTMINNFLRKAKGGKISFTHILAYAMVQALKTVPAMNNAYAEIDGKPHLIENHQINLGMAIDVVNKDGSRKLVVPAIKGAEQMDFLDFWRAYEEIVRKGRTNELTIEDFKGVTASLTNPGGFGTNHSIARLMPGQGMILGVGSIDYPAAYQGNSPTRMAELGISKVTTLTSTYDHRIIQGAQSGEFLRRMHQLLLGADRFYENIFESLRIPYAPVQWASDRQANRPDQVGKQARVIELIDSWRRFGHLSADIDPIEYRPRFHHDLMLNSHGLTLWDMDRTFPIANFAGQRDRKSVV